MPTNQLKRFPTAILRRGMAHFHPLGPVALSRSSTARAQAACAQRAAALPEVVASTTAPEPELLPAD